MSGNADPITFMVCFCKNDWGIRKPSFIIKLNIIKVEQEECSGGQGQIDKTGSGEKKIK